ncbi:tyrosine-type recombinase/integrase [Paraburkholderia silvatlantica]|uniref:Integrase n=1 Tax=Paraburkholderia silvatlantica TaxID=321895 RepID=A0ABR6FU83_9BURK|nr:site-specific integrase [Paraburkholderia silvatlantica]MBB2930993.1 integrase [Paraburkholderia silvatlantica]
MPRHNPAQNSPEFRYALRQIYARAGSMAAYRKRGSTWRAEVAKGGIRESKTFDTKAEAVTWATQLEAEIDAGRRRSYSKVQKTLADAFDEYLEKVSPGKGKHEWNKTRLEFFREELEFVGALIRKVRPEDISAWRDKRLKIVKASTVNRDLNLLSAVFQSAQEEWKWIHANPVREVKRPEDPPPRRRRVSDEEARVMARALGLTDEGDVATIQQYTAIAFLIAIETGMRQGEIVGLIWSNVHLANRYVHLPKTKNGDARDVPLSTRAVALFERLPKVAGEARCFPVSQGSVDALWRKVRAKVVKERPEFADLNFHDSRHEATTRLARRLNVLALARMIGHRNIQSLMIYYDETAAELAARLD